MKMCRNSSSTLKQYVIKIWLLVASIVLVLPTFSICEAQETRDVRSDSPAPSTALSAATANRTSPFDPPTSDVFIADNGNGLDTGCTFNTDAGHPLVIEVVIDKFVGDVDADGYLIDPSAFITAGIIPAKVAVKMPAYDVDVTGGPPAEKDEVLFNGESVGFLTGDNNIWKLNDFTIDIRKVKFPQRPGNGSSVTPVTNKIQINVDTLSSGSWCTAIDWVAMHIPIRPKLALKMSVGEGGNKVRQNTGEETIDVIYEQEFDQTCTVTTTTEAIDEYPFSGFTGGGSPNLKAKIKTCPENSIDPPEVSVEWTISGGGSDSKTWSGFEGDFPVAVPDKIGSYLVNFTYTVNDNKNNHQETLGASRKLFATKASPNDNVNPPRRAWYEKATAWAAGKSDEAAIHAAVLQGVYSFGGANWQYSTYPQCRDWSGMVNDPITCTQADCYLFSDVFSAMSKTLGVDGMYREIQRGSLEKGFLTVLGQQSIDPLFRGNAKAFEGTVYDRYRFLDHSLRRYNNNFYDATFNKIYSTKNEFVAFNQTGETLADANGPYLVTVEGAKIYQLPGQAPASPGADWDNYSYLLPPAPLSTSALIANAEATVGGLQFPDTANYRLIDTENDGIYEALAVDVDVEITQAGSYTIGCELRKNGQLITSGQYHSSADCTKTLIAESGKQTVTLMFSGEEIFRSGQDGPYDLNLSVLGETNTKSLQTPNYDHQTFGELLAYITGAHDEGVDENGDGMLEGLRVTMDLIVRASGNYRFAGSLYKDGKPSISNAYADDVMLTAGQTQYSFVFPGLPLRRSGLNGPYDGGLSLEESSGEGNRYAVGFKFVTQPYQFQNFASVFELVDGSVADKGVDNNGNGLFDLLNVTVDASFSQAATYLLESQLELTSTSGTYHTSSISQSITVTPGIRQLSFDFDGAYIFKRQIDGPYRAEVVLKDPETHKVIDRLQLPQETKSYSYTEFDPNQATVPAIVLTGSSSNRGVDTDGDGLFNQLQVEVGVKLKTSGTYVWSARLVDSTGTEIGFYTHQLDLSAGDAQISFVFDGSRIGTNGQDGPYFVKDLLIAGPSGSNLVSFDLATTYAYKASEFEGFVPPKIRGDLNGDSLVDDLDIALLKNALGSKVGDPKFNPDADLYRDERINGKDLQILLDLTN
ncbi:dockerin type I domain-containing protein [Methylomicrobium lacus]|uniref:dockerin type I domain-containing protein n=1 Tax=Methylomicrobium lacus TaxID=136992 RepID=UPI00045E7B98|nr:dockerin type I domain-containing protein [Methylomicrobium lacus]